jgi:hypothetical protein
MGYAVKLQKKSGGEISTITTLVDRRSVSTKVDLAIITLTDDYPVIVCIASPGFGVYTSPKFISDNSSSKIISARISEYGRNNPLTPSSIIFVTGNSDISYNDVNCYGQSFGLVTSTIFSCKSGDTISIQTNSQYGGSTNVKVTVYGAK